jgi:DNA-binding protein HU-beta
MRKKDVIKELRENFGLTANDAGKVYDYFFSAIADRLQKNDKVSLPGIGTLKIVQRSERKCRNPQTGEQMTIPAKNALKFSAASAIKKAIN